MHIQSSDNPSLAFVANPMKTRARPGNRPCARRSALLGSIASLGILAHPAWADELVKNVSGADQPKATGDQTCQSNIQPGILYNVACTASNGTQPGQVGSGNGATGGAGNTATVDPLTVNSDYSGAAGLSTIDLSATGGVGGKGGQAANTNNSSAATGGTGGVGGDGAKLVVAGDSGTIQTPSAANSPVRLQSQGGIGGVGGDPGHAKNANTLDGNGGAGGTGGNGGDIRFTLDSADAAVMSQQSGVAAIDITSQAGWAELAGPPCSGTPISAVDRAGAAAPAARST